MRLEHCHPRPRLRLLHRCDAAFTLIEVLVVVAVIAVLIAILLPSLHRARDTARLSVCMLNVRQLGVAAATYSLENAGRLPGAVHSDGITGFDWAGKHNWDGRNRFGRVPEDGTIYRNAGRNNSVYLCPSDPLLGRKIYSDSGGYIGTFVSYLLTAALSGARTETLIGAHTTTAIPFNNLNHRSSMRALTGVPLFVEGLYQGFSSPKETPSGHMETKYNPTWWVDDASVANRHQAGHDDTGTSSVAFHDGSAGTLKYPGVPRPMVAWSRRAEREQQMWKWFHAKSICIRSRGGRWVNMRSFDTNGKSKTYGWLDTAPDASSAGMQH